MNNNVMAVDSFDYLMVDSFARTGDLHGSEPNLGKSGAVWDDGNIPGNRWLTGAGKAYGNTSQSAGTSGRIELDAQASRFAGIGACDTGKMLFVEMRHDGFEGGGQDSYFIRFIENAGTLDLRLGITQGGSITALEDITPAIAEYTAGDEFSFVVKDDGNETFTVDIAYNGLSHTQVWTGAVNSIELDQFNGNKFTGIKTNGKDALTYFKQLRVS